MSQKPSEILVADDERHSREALVEFLQLRDYTVHDASNGADFSAKAEEIICRGVPFILIVDNQMPDKPGDDRDQQWSGFTRVVRLCLDHHHCNVAQRTLFLSRWGIADLPDELRKQGETHQLLSPDHWMMFPVSYAVLDAAMQRLLTHV